MTSKDFNIFRFEGLEHKEYSKGYLTMKRVSDDQNKIVIKTFDTHLFSTKFGYAFILDYSHVVFLKEWQVNENRHGIEVLLSREYFNVKEWGEHIDFDDSDETLDFDFWVHIALEQEKELDLNGKAANPVMWRDR